MTTELAAQCWIHNPDGFHEDKANMWFAEYIQMLNFKKVTEQVQIMSKIKRIFDNSKKKNKAALIHYYWLYNAIHTKDSEAWKEFIKKREQFIGGCFHYYIVILYLFNELTYTTNNGRGNIDLDKFDTHYSNYSKERFYKTGLSLSGFTEAGLLSAAGNIALSNNDTERFKSYLRKAQPELANDRKKYSLIENSIKSHEEVNLKVYFDLNSKDGE